MMILWLSGPSCVTRVRVTVKVVQLGFAENTYSGKSRKIRFSLNTTHFVLSTIAIAHVVDKFERTI